MFNPPRNANKFFRKSIDERRLLGLCRHLISLILSNGTFDSKKDLRCEWAIAHFVCYQMTSKRNVIPFAFLFWKSSDAKDDDRDDEGTKFESIRRKFNRDLKK